MKGKVYIIGIRAGEIGPPSLRALEVLREAEVVLHDESVPQEVLEMLPAWTQVRNCGGQAGMPQEKINRSLVSAAREGKLVVRLRHGQSILFEENSEEVEALREAGIDFEVILGTTAEMAARAKVA